MRVSLRLKLSDSSIRAEGIIDMGDLFNCCDTGMPSLEIRASRTGRDRVENSKFTGIEREHEITDSRIFTADILFTSEQTRLRGTGWGDTRVSRILFGSTESLENIRCRQDGEHQSLHSRFFSPLYSAL